MLHSQFRSHNQIHSLKDLDFEKGESISQFVHRPNHHQGGVSQNLSSVTNDSFCYKLLKSLLLIGYQQICH